MIRASFFVLLVVGAFGGGSPADCKLSPSHILPDSISWMRVQRTRAIDKGDQLHPLGVEIILRVKDIVAWKQQQQDYSFLDPVLGPSNGSRDLIKDAILLKQDDLPVVLKQTKLLSAAGEADSAWGFLFASWHCSDTDLWPSFVSWLSAMCQQPFKCSSRSCTANISTNTVEFRESPRPLPSNLLIDWLDRTLEGDGSHRKLHTKLSLRLSSLDHRDHRCDLLLLEHLPASVFADAFELHRMTQRAEIKDAHLYGDSDLERPAAFSFQSLVELRTRLPLAANTTQLQVDLYLPLHARYAPLSLDSHFIANLSLPQMMVHCTDAAGQLLQLQELVVDFESSSSSSRLLQWPIPAGNLAHLSFVPTFTALAVTAATALLVVVIVSASSSST